MGEILVRATRDEGSAYLLWSTIEDAPTFIFASRAEALAHLEEEWRFSHPIYDDEHGHFKVPDEVISYPGDRDTPEARMKRADEYGSSAFSFAYRWNDDEFVCLGEMSKNRAPGTQLRLPRARLQAFAEAMLDDDLEAAGALLVAHVFDDEEDSDEDTR